MGSQSVSELTAGTNYKASEIDSFVENNHVTVISNNENQLFTEPDREYKVVYKFGGYFDHSEELGGKRFVEKPTYVVEKV
ncbi:hypothetical protein [Marinococcus luteus]|jgi:hypothetical protein|uniref:hypothetical protein n=1 Tax=Marinococcus luteus TaxID=1122204 RepID=UPI002ACCBBF6|nr:hypothetical protein [Marinococcus luteus]MDZ5782727.1 hypothetical protein [Marinococcus luteus]